MADTPRSLPERFTHPSAVEYFAYFIAIAFVAWSFSSVGISLSEFATGLPNMGRFLSEMFPPDLSRFGAVMKSILETFQIALVGAILGILFGFLLAIPATRHLTPHPIVYTLARSIIALFRTIPDLIWAIFFVATVGLGAFAGTLAIVVDTIGFCGRFFAEAMEETDRGPQDALAAIGANRSGIIFSAVVPAAMPSFVNTGLFSLEKAVRSSVVLGLVGAGGIGIELKVAMDMFMYSQAATIILLVFVLVLIVERLSSHIRNRYLQTT
jgi:phosphonate transport system permease protein